MQQAMRIPGKPHIDTPGLTPEGQLKQYFPCRGYGDWLSMSLNSMSWPDTVRSSCVAPEQPAFVYRWKQCILTNSGTLKGKQVFLIITFAFLTDEIQMK